jgi:hypothetical protein
MSRTRLGFRKQAARALGFLFRSLCAVLLVCATSRAGEGREYVLISGGVSLDKWEQYKEQPHDRWWMNFVRAARIRIQQIRSEDPGAHITWLVYRPAYERRGTEDQKDLLSLIDSVRTTYALERRYFSSGTDVVNYLKRGKDRTKVKVCDFEYFGHSNKACWMFDYSNFIDSSSKAWLHEEELSTLSGDLFTADCHAKSWGCHTGESMSKRFFEATGVRMWGAVGKTQYRTEELPMLSSRWGRWKR